MSFGYEEMLRMPAHILIGLWEAYKKIVEKRNKEEEKRNKESSSGSTSVSLPSGMSSMLSQVQSMSSGSVRLPSMPSHF